MVLTSRELAAVLAGLRHYQSAGRYCVADIATNCGEFDALNGEEIDALCERLNVGPRAPNCSASERAEPWSGT